VRVCDSRGQAAHLRHFARGCTEQTSATITSVADVTAPATREGKDEEEIQREKARGQAFDIFVLISQTLDCLKNRITAVGKRQIGVFLSQHVS
jgi:hypothetical protein